MESERLNDIVGRSDELKELCFGFFMAFSRFEFALKENGYYREGRYGEAEPDWHRYQADLADCYTKSPQAKALMLSPPKQQVIDGGRLAWKDINLKHESTLGNIILVLKTIRNNLFHGGKHGAEDWDKPERTAFLLKNGIRVLDELAALGNITSDYERCY